MIRRVVGKVGRQWGPSRLSGPRAEGCLWGRRWMSVETEKKPVEEEKKKKRKKKSKVEEAKVEASELLSEAVKEPFPVVEVEKDAAQVSLEKDKEEMMKGMSGLSKRTMDWARE